MKRGLLPSKMTADRIDSASLLKHRAFVRAVARRLLSDPNLVDDVEQQTWMAALEKPPRDRQALGAWLGQVARRLSLRTLRDRARRRTRERRGPPPSRPPSPDELADTLAWQQRVVAEVLALSPEHRAVILLRFYEDLPPRESARRLGIPVNTVRTRTRRAVEQLRRRLDDGSGRTTWTAGLLPLLRRPLPVTGGLLTGVVLMGTKVKLAAAALLIVLVAWQFMGSRERVERRAEPETRTSKTSPSVPAAAKSCLLKGRVVNGKGRVLIKLTDGDVVEMGAGETFSFERAEPGRSVLQARDEAGAQAQLAVEFVHGERDLGAITLMRSVDVAGVVLAPDGSPAARALVEAWAAPVMLRNVLTWDDPLRALRAAQAPGPVLGSVWTDGSGRFALPLARGGELVLRARKGDVVSPALTALDYSRDTGTIVLRLARGARASGRVVDVSGRPVRDAVVQLFAAPRTMTYRFEGPALAAAVRTPAVRTDASGRFVLPAVPPGHYAVAVRHERFVPAWRSWVAVPGARLSFRLAPGQTLTGLVTVGGEPAPGTRLLLVPRDQTLLAQETVASADGRFSFSRVPLGAPFHLFAQGPLGTALLQNVTGVLGEPLLVKLDAGRAISGRVLDAEGRPVAGYRVQAWEFKVHTSRAAYVRGYRETVTDTDGRFSLGGVSSRRPVFLNGRGNRDWTNVGYSADPNENNVDLHTQRTRLTPGRVIDAQGRPVAGAEIYHAYDGQGRDDPALHRERAFTDAAGRFLLGGIDPRYATGSVAARKAGFAPARSLRLQHDTKEVEIKLVRGRRLAGTVRDVDGAPVAHAHVSLQTKRRSVLETFTDGEGRYVFVWDGGEFEFLVHRPGFLLRRSRATDVVLKRSHRRSGRVVAPDGTPVVAARVSPGGSVAFSGPDGRFELDGVPARGKVQVVAPGFATRNVTLDRDGIDIVLAPGRAIAGHVFLANKEPAVGRVVMVFDGKVSRGAGVRADGSFRIEGLPEGRYTVSVAMAGYEPRRNVATGSTGLVFQPAPPGTLSGLILDSAGRGIAGVTVRLLADGGSPMFLGSRHTDDAGKFVFDGVRGTKFLVYADWPGHATKPAKVEGERRTVTIVFGLGGRTISGRVQRTDGSARHSPGGATAGDIPGGLRVYVEGAKSEGVAKVAPDGTFTITGLEPGRYRVYATSAPGLHTRQEGVAAGTANVVLKLRR